MICQHVKASENLNFFLFSGKEDSRLFDVTLMITLLLNLTSLDHYIKLPLVTDTTKSADLARIKLYRNQISHPISNKVDGKIDNIYFNTAWNDISGVSITL